MYTIALIELEPRINTIGPIQLSELPQLGEIIKCARKNGQPELSFKVFDLTFSNGIYNAVVHEWKEDQD